MRRDINSLDDEWLVQNTYNNDLLGGYKIEMMKRLKINIQSLEVKLDHLANALEKFDHNSSRAATAMLRLSWAMLIIAIITVALTAMQILNV